MMNLRARFDQAHHVRILAANLPGQIETMELQTTELRTRFADPAVYREGAATLKGLQDQLAAREAELAAAYARWEALEARQVAARANSEN